MLVVHFVPTVIVNICSNIKAPRFGINLWSRAQVTKTYSVGSNTSGQSTSLKHGLELALKTGPQKASETQCIRFRTLNDRISPNKRLNCVQRTIVKIPLKN